MTKLKTVKDLGNDVQWIGRETLKQEAIEWVLNCKICKTARPIPICSRHEVLCDFNNIKEEDLK